MGLGPDRGAIFPGALSQLSLSIRTALTYSSSAHCGPNARTWNPALLPQATVSRALLDTEGPLGVSTECLD